MEPRLDLAIRPRRNRRNAPIRSIIAETCLAAQHLVMPLFVTEGRKRRKAILSMPGISRTSLDLTLEQVEQLRRLGVRGLALFPYLEPRLRDGRGSQSLDPQGLMPRAIAAVKERFPDMVIFSDVALDPYSSTGHDGLVQDGQIVNDESVAVLAQMALVQAQAGADYVAPSDMMDGRVGAIRRALDQAGFSQTGIMSYAAKYASSFYGPFRDALDSSPKAGDKKTYQMDPRNRREALREVALDQAEGADMVMVKPALAYLDVIAAVRQQTTLPVAAYNTSGEYSMLKAGAKAGFLEHDAAMAECLLSIRRAGADFIFTYFAQEMAVLLKKG